MNYSELKTIFMFISDTMTENKDYLIKLDQQNGDGDLGISMSNGFKAVSDYLAEAEETDLGKLFFKASSVFNEAAPSSLGTILSFCFMGMAQALKDKNDASLLEMADAMEFGIKKVMERAGSKPGEKTVLDALCPGVESLVANAAQGSMSALKSAMIAAKKGSDSTKQMRSVHGRAAYYGDNSIGIIDGGSVAGYLIFEGLYKYTCSKV